MLVEMNDEQYFHATNKIQHLTSSALSVNTNKAHQFSLPFFSDISHKDITKAFCELPGIRLRNASHN